VLGYVDTGYLGRTGMTTTRVNPGSTELADWQAQARADAEQWYRLYGRFGLAGIFFDQTLSECGDGGQYVDVYGDLGSGVQRRHRGALIAINPGTSVAECYTAVADVIVIFENTWEMYQGWAPPEWVFRHPETMFWHLVHGAPTVADMRAAVALSRQRNAGFVYVTSHTITPEASPWNALPDPDYWAAQLRAVSRPSRD
jgi:Spherulation-specific family 4